MLSNGLAEGHGGTNPGVYKASKGSKSSLKIEIYKMFNELEGMNPVSTEQKSNFERDGGLSFLRTISSLAISIFW